MREPSVPFLLIWQVLQTANVSGVISDAPQLEIEVGLFLFNLYNVYIFLGIGCSVLLYSLGSRSVNQQ